jgi:transcriptional regulator with XRE-family HTH domain
MTQGPHAARDETSGQAEAAVLAKALRRAAERMGLSQAALAEVIGVSPAKVTRVFAGEATLTPHRKEGQLALLLLRIFRSLDTVVGGNPEALRAWFHAQNHHLQGVPAELVARPEGLARVADYLDGVRGTL